MGLGRPRRYDAEYRREGTCHLSMFFRPLRGWRRVKGTDRRTAEDFAHCMTDRVDTHSPEGTLMRVGMDHLNPHTPAALYEAFPPAEARRILRRLDLRYTPKHGSWLNMAAMEFAVSSTQGLGRRLPSQAAVRWTAAAGETRRTLGQIKVNGRFTLTRARRTLKRLYLS
jgi:DDE superfamily endonuclease